MDKIKMDARVKDLWLKALMSGEYKQGRGTLKRGDEWCCLGVLCDIFLKEKGLNWVKGETRSELCVGDSAILPSPVREWAGLSAVPFTNKGYLTHLNDHDGFNFAQIADAIKESL